MLNLIQEIVFRTKISSTEKILTIFFKKINFISQTINNKFKFKELNVFKEEER